MRGPASTGRRPPPAAPIEVLFLLGPDALLLDVAGPAEAFRIANQERQRGGRPPLFRLRFVAARHGATSSVGLGLGPLEPLPERLRQPTWVVLVGRAGTWRRPPAAQWGEARSWLGRVVGPALAAGGDAAGMRLVTICTGSLLAAEAGLVAARRCTTHHQHLDDLRRLAPRAQVVENRVFVEDGPVVSSAGITAGIDLALHLVAGVGGGALAAAVAQAMVVYLRRGPHDPEQSPYLAFRDHMNPVVQRVQDVLCEAPARDWPVPSMAAVGHVTPRHLTRLFARHAGIGPLGYLQRIRLVRAHESLASGASVTQAAEAAGFGSDKALRRAWKLHAGGSPRDAARRQARGAPAATSGPPRKQMSSSTRNGEG